MSKKDNIIKSKTEHIAELEETLKWYKEQSELQLKREKELKDFHINRYARLNEKFGSVKKELEYLRYDYSLLQVEFQAVSDTLDETKEALLHVSTLSSLVETDRKKLELSYNKNLIDAPHTFMQAGLPTESTLMEGK